MFENSQAKKVVKPDISSFFVELSLDFLPEPLILTILLDSKTPLAHHISIEKEPKPSAQEPLATTQIKDLLFGGKKGYTWMASFLGLMDTIKLNKSPTMVATGGSQKMSSGNRELIMTQYMLKMLTILTNILVGNLITLESRQAQES